MTLLHHSHQALVNLAAAKLRSFLAVLGVLVGTAAVVALISSGQLATQKALAQFKTLGIDLLAISVYQKNTQPTKSHDQGVSLKQWRQLPERVSAVLQIAPYSFAYQPLSFAGKALQGTIIGADEALARIANIQLAQGHFVSFVDRFEHFCVIGAGLAQQLLQQGLNNPIGKQLNINQMLYTIIGVAKPWQENGFFYEDINQAVIIPLLGMALVSKDSKINNAVMRLRPDSAVDEVISQLKQILLADTAAVNLLFRSPKQIIASMESQGQIFTWLLAVIGSISLLVGGIGVMNVMLVSVSERKKEIGIRKAMGATNKEIQVLFLVESVMLAFLGGFLGVLLGVLLTRVIAYFTHWPFTIPIMPPFVGFAVSVVTGIFFGFYPAKRAARLEPIASLRNE